MTNSCKCGRSPNGQCNGWHKLSRAKFLKKLQEHDIQNLKKESDDRIALKKQHD